MAHRLSRHRERERVRRAAATTQSSRQVRGTPIGLGGWLEPRASQALLRSPCYSFVGVSVATKTVTTTLHRRSRLPHRRLAFVLTSATHSHFFPPRRAGQSMTSSTQDQAETLPADNDQSMFSTTNGGVARMFAALVGVRLSLGRLECTVGWGQFNDDNIRLRVAKEWTRVCISYCWTMKTTDPEKMEILVGGNWDEQQFYSRFWIKVLQCEPLATTQRAHRAGLRGYVRHRVEIQRRGAMYGRRRGQRQEGSPGFR